MRTIIVGAAHHRCYRFLVRCAFGATRHELAAELGCSIQRVYEILRHLKVHDLVKSCGGMWFANVINARVVPGSGQAVRRQMQFAVQPCDDDESISDEASFARSWLAVGEWQAQIPNVSASVFALAAEDSAKSFKNWNRSAT